jgi:hypothetical protein
VLRIRISLLIDLDELVVNPAVPFMKRDFILFTLLI